MYNITKYNHTNNYLLKPVNNAKGMKAQNKKHGKTSRVEKVMLGGLLKFLVPYSECSQNFQLYITR